MHNFSFPSFQNSKYSSKFIVCLKLSGAVVNTLHCHSTGFGLDPEAGQGLFSLSSLMWVDKMSTKLAWELNTGGPHQVDHLTRAYAMALWGPWSRKQNLGHYQLRSIIDCNAEFNFYCMYDITITFHL